MIEPGLIDKTFLHMNSDDTIDFEEKEHGLGIDFGDLDLDDDEVRSS